MRLKLRNKPIVNVAIGERVRELRTAADLSQEQFARLAGIDRAFVSRIERGEKNISVDTLAKLVSALDVSVHDFFDANHFDKLP